MITLGIETSCDDTAVAILRDAEVVVYKKYFQEKHAEFGGIVPEIASREHIAYIYKLVNDCILESNTKLNKINLIAVTRGPGLIGSLLVGFIFAKTLSYSLKIPYIGVNHLEGHIYSGLLSNNDIEYPFINLLISGGNTLIIKVESEGIYKILGQTRDDAAGEAIDKVGFLLGYKYPAGAEMEKNALQGDPEKYRFPRPSPSGFDLSYSGLKTSVLYFLREKNIEEINKNKNNIAASFLSALIDSLLFKVEMALKSENIKTLLVTGGVAINSILQNKFKKYLNRRNITTYFPRDELCGDNAQMIAYLGEKLFKRKGKGDSLDLGVDPRLKIKEKNK